MTSLGTTGELHDVFHARKVKAPELKGLDTIANAARGYVKNRIPVLPGLKKQAARVTALEPKVRDLGSTRFQEEVADVRAAAKLGKLEGEQLDYGVALVREAALRTLDKRPYDVQIMGAMAMYRGYVAEMATGEGKTLTAALTAALWGWMGKPVHVITVNDYLVARDAELNRPLYEMLGLSVGSVTHETTPPERMDIYRRGVVYVTSKELVADFLRDQIMLGTMKTSAQTAIALLQGGQAGRTIVPGLHRALIDEADSLLVDEAVTPLIISNSPNDNPNEELYRAANELAKHLEKDKDFKVDSQVRHIDMTQRGRRRLAEMADDSGFWKGARRREELVVQALSAQHCFHKDEHYLVDPEGKIVIIDEFTGRTMADRSWRGGLHQAVEIKEGVEVTADKENLARLSFQRFFRQYPKMAGMTGTAWESAPELWQIYQLAVVPIPTNKPCIREQLPLRFFGKADEKWDAVTERILELHKKNVPILVGTRSVWSSDEVSKRLRAKGVGHSVLNAAQNAEEAEIVARAGQPGMITVATNMAGRGTDIGLARDVADMGGLHVIATEPHGSHRVDRQLFGRAARQGDPGSAQMFASAEDDLLVRHTPKLRHRWRTIGGARLIKMAQNRAEHIARFNRKQVLRADDWMDQSMPF
jgi:preprotein translocase subunit SecA